MKRKILSVLGVLMAVLMALTALTACNKTPAGAENSGGVSGESVSESSESERSEQSQNESGVQGESSDEKESGLALPADNVGDAAVQGRRADITNPPENEKFVKVELSFSQNDSHCLYALTDSGNLYYFGYEKGKMELFDTGVKDFSAHQIYNSVSTLYENGDVAVYPLGYYTDCLFFSMPSAVSVSGNAFLLDDGRINYFTDSEWQTIDVHAKKMREYSHEICFTDEEDTLWWYSAPDGSLKKLAEDVDDFDWKNISKGYFSMDVLYTTTSGELKLLRQVNGLYCHDYLGVGEMPESAVSMAFSDEFYMVQKPDGTYFQGNIPKSGRCRDIQIPGVYCTLSRLSYAIIGTDGKLYFRIEEEPYTFRPDEEFIVEDFVFEVPKN